MLRKYLPEQEPGIEVIAGAPSPQLWRNIRFALTVQSTVALQCAAQGIPVFLCSWLRDTTSGYLEQFARFGIGHVLESAGELSEIPRLLEIKGKTLNCGPSCGKPWTPRNCGICCLRTTSFSEAMKAPA